MTGEHVAVPDGVWAFVTEKEPVIMTALCGAGFSAAVTWLGAHGLTDASTAVQAAEPSFTAAAALLAGVILRHFVTSPANARKAQP